MNQPHLERINTLSGRSVKQLKKDAKRHKRTLKITQQEALNLTMKEQGLAPSWQRFMTRATELFGQLTNTPYQPPLAKSTVFLGTTGSNFSRLATHQWFRMLSQKQQVIDVFIDVHGDTLTYATLNSYLPMAHGLRKLNVLSSHTLEDNTLISQRFSAEPDTLKRLLKALFEDEREQQQALLHLQGEYTAPPHVVARLKDSQTLGLLMWLDDNHGQRGYPLNRILPFCGSTLFLMPPLTKVEPLYRTILTDVLHTCLESAAFDPRGVLPMRITITGLSGREPIPESLIKRLITDPNIELIMHCEAAGDSPWLDTAISLAEQCFVARIHNSSQVPPPFRCVSNRLLNLPTSRDGTTPVQLFNHGQHVDIEMNLSCESLLLNDKFTAPTHRNGDPITAP